MRACWSIYRSYGIRRLWKNIRLRFLQLQVRKIDPKGYALLMTPTDRQLAQQRKKYSEMKKKIHFCIFFQADSASGSTEQRLLDSLQKQSWPEWSLHRIGSNWQTESPQGTEGSFLIFPAPDMILAPNALFELADCLNRHPGTEFLYSDEAFYETEITHPFFYYFKPDFSEVSLYSGNYIGFSWCVSRKLFEEVGGLNGPVSSASVYDFIFRVLNRTKQIRHLARPLFFSRQAKQSLDPAVGRRMDSEEIKVLQTQLQRKGLAGTVEPIGAFPFFRIHYQLAGKPLVSILIPSKDQHLSLKKCIDSILLRSTYRNFEIVVLENGSSEPETESYYQEIGRNPAIRVIRYPRQEPFNYSRLNNYGAECCRGEYIVFLNNDTEVITPAWLEEMLMFAQRSDIGAVGAKLYFQDHTIQHAGVLVGYMGAADHYFLRFPKDAPGYAGRLLYAQNLSAVTFACCMVRKTVFEQAGRLDEELSVSFNDIDFCLRLRSMGFQVVWTPFAELYHYESMTRGYDESEQKRQRLRQEISRLQQKWDAFFEQGDPAYNPNLSLVSTDFSLRHPLETQMIRATRKWNQSIQ